jgi:hypothetical protein
MTTETKPKGHFPRKGERLVNGVWVMPKPQKPSETATDRRNWLRRMAGWPVKEN